MHGSMPRSRTPLAHPLGPQHQLFSGTWCTRINTETETDHRLFHGNTDRHRPTLKNVTP